MQIGKFNITKKLILRVVVISYLLYIVYISPKEDYENNVLVKAKGDNGGEKKFYPDKVTYLQYIKAWWSSHFENDGFDTLIQTTIFDRWGFNLDQMLS